MNISLSEKSIAVIGLCSRGVAACSLLRGCGVRLRGIDDEPERRERARAGLHALGVEVSQELPDAQLDLAVLSPKLSPNSQLLATLASRRVPLIGELELGFQLANCLTLAIAGTNGKGTTAELVEAILNANHRKLLHCGHGDRPICAAVRSSREVDYLLIQASAAQLERIEFFRPAVAVLTNLVHHQQEGFSDPDEYARACGRVFRNQLSHDWALVQSEALARLRDCGVQLRSKLITFSAHDTAADLFLDRGLLISRLPNWSGPLVDLEHCGVWGPHNAENVMAALAVGHVLRLSLESMLDAVKRFDAGPHRCEKIAEIAGVVFINDSKAGNLDAMQKAVLGAPRSHEMAPNIWLLAGGLDEGAEYHDAGPVLSQRVKGAFLFGQAAEKMRAAWSLFTPCAVTRSLLEAVQEAARNSVSGDVVLLSPSCSRFDQFRDQEQVGEVFCSAVKSIPWGADVRHPNINGKNQPN